MQSDFVILSEPKILPKKKMFLCSFERKFWVKGVLLPYKKFTVFLGQTDPTGQSIEFSSGGSKEISQNLDNGSKISENQ